MGIDIGIDIGINFSEVPEEGWAVLPAGTRVRAAIGTVPEG